MKSKPWEKPQLIKQEDRWVVVVPVDDRTCRHLDVTEDMNGWIEQETAPLRDPFPPGHLGDYMVQVRAERDLYRDALKDLFQSIDQAAHAKAIEWDRHSPTMNAARKALGL